MSNSVPMQMPPNCTSLQIAGIDILPDENDIVLVPPESVADLKANGFVEMPSP
jgi:hypothetical protein